MGAPEIAITDVTVDRLRLPLDPPFVAAWDPVPRTALEASIVTVHTDAGVSGVGAGDGMGGFEAYRELFLGRDPRAIAEHVRVLETLAFHAGRYWPLEAALWDVVGKLTGQPVATLLGGATDRLPAYASFGQLLPPAERAAVARQVVGEGFRAVKLRVAPAQLAEGLAAVRATREAVGDDVDVMVDLNQMWRMPGDTGHGLDVVTARRVAAELAELGVLWLEEPLPQADPRGLRQLRDVAGTRVAGGEMVRTPAELLALLDADALDVYQHDAVLAVGLLRGRTIAELAQLRNRWFTPHTWSDGLGLAANLHLAAGVGAGPYLEYPYDPPGWTPERRDFFLDEPLRVDADGCLRVPEAPGLGVAVDPDAVERFRRR